MGGKEVVIFESVPRPFFVDGCHGNTQIHVYQVSAPCIAWFASLRSEEVVIGKSAGGHYLLTVVMETMKYTCAQSFISMCTIVGKFEKERSENCLRLRLSVVGGCHENQLSVMGVM